MWWWCGLNCAVIHCCEFRSWCEICPHECLILFYFISLLWCKSALGWIELLILYNKINYTIWRIKIAACTRYCNWLYHFFLSHWQLYKYKYAKTISCITWQLSTLFCSWKLEVIDIGNYWGSNRYEPLPGPDFSPIDSWVCIRQKSWPLITLDGHIRSSFINCKCTYVHDYSYFSWLVTRW